MAYHKEKKPSTPADRMFLVIVIIIVAIVLGLAVFATYGKISSNIEEKAISEESEAIQNGEQDATVRYMASSAGMDVDEYLEQYGLKLGDGLTKTSTVMEMLDKMTVENYYKYSDESSGTEEATDVDQLLTDWGAEELGITKDTVWEDAMAKLPISKYLGGDEDYQSFVDTYTDAGYDVSSITADMPVTEAQDKIEEILTAGPVTTPTAEPEATEEAAAATAAAAAPEATTAATAAAK